MMLPTGYQVTELRAEKCDQNITQVILIVLTIVVFTMNQLWKLS